MAKTPDINDVESRVEAFLSTRRDAVRALATTHAQLQQVNASAEQERAALEERLAASVATAQPQDAQAWSAALSAGWTEDELRRLGFVEPVTKARPRRRRNVESAPVRSSAAASSAPPSPGADAAGDAASQVSAHSSAVAS